VRQSRNNLRKFEYTSHAGVVSNVVTSKEIGCQKIPPPVLGKPFSYSQELDNTARRLGISSCAKPLRRRSGEPLPAECSHPIQPTRPALPGASGGQESMRNKAFPFGSANQGNGPLWPARFALGLGSKKFWGFLGESSCLRQEGSRWVRTIPLSCSRPTERAPGVFFVSKVQSIQTTQAGRPSGASQGHQRNRTTR
jgi:hypothetical protein